ncbi:MAG: hypothetical protein KIT09_31975 [Bryobacteraceae bacterium]|nr:hypothetical protein [Bryobacteraceae bacterium]
MSERAIKVNPEAESYPTDHECRALVERILASAEFNRTKRLRDFLVYVVEHKLAGESQQVSEVYIGQRVFGRPPNYNPGEDSIVRTEARNLRQRLERYFAGEGIDERLILEIPRGGYVPVFRPRPAPAKEPIPPPPPATRRTMWIWLGGALTAAAGLTFLWRLQATIDPGDPGPARPLSRQVGALQLDSSDPRLVRAFASARQRALGYVYTGDAIGDWYDSTAGNRYAFCMRDASHQSTGAALLGLTGHTRNMFRRFAGSIARTRDWCGFWEINKDGFPAPADYRSDQDFWYCLPANFDLMQAAYRQFLWTNDRSYFDATFSDFYDRTVTSYVEAWDRDGDGIMESRPAPRYRGIASYYQEEPRPLVGADLVAAQYRGYLVYAAIQERKGAKGSLSQKLAGQYRSKAEALRARFNAEWWNPLQNRYYASILPDGKYFDGYIADANVFTLRFGIAEPGAKTEAALDALEKIRPAFDQTLSYIPELLFEYGRNESAHRLFLELADPDFQSAVMPEIVFAAVAAVGTGLMGLSPDAPNATVETQPRLPEEVAWVRLSRAPVLDNEVAVYHRGVTETTFTNQSGPLVYWKASFPAKAGGQIFVDGEPVPSAVEERANRQAVVSAVAPVKPGQARTAQYR